MPTIYPNTKNFIDLSIIPSYLCNLECSFCMYSCSLKCKDFIDLDVLERFISTIDWKIINSIGLYGGEISLYIDFCQKILDMIPKTIPKFCITNGSWSTYKNNFVSFCKHYNMKVAISSTPEHTKYQNQEIIKEICEDTDFFLKENDLLSKMNPMGRLARDNWTCSFKCKRIDKPTRYAVCPNGDIIFQNCDGVYPIVSNYKKTFKILTEKRVLCVK